MYADPNVSQKRSVDKTPSNVDTIQRLQLNKAIFCQFQQLMGIYPLENKKQKSTYIDL